MFEGKPPILPLQEKVTPGDSQTEELSVLSWSDLQAKLAAARDLRTVVVEDERGEIASFHADSARCLAHHTDRTEDEGQRDVNPDDLANGKARGRKDSAPIHSSEPDARGNT